MYFLSSHLENTTERIVHVREFLSHDSICNKGFIYLATL